MDERERWNTHYTSRVDRERGEAHPFLREHLGLLPKGRVLELAMGDGQNAIFLARQGFSVTGIDVSEVAVERASTLSRIAGVAIDAQCLDLRHTNLPADAYDVVICFYYLQRDLFPQILRALRLGGMVVYETFTAEQARYRQSMNPAYLLQPNELLKVFRALRIRIYRDLIVEGPKAIASLVAEKVGHS